MNQFLSNKIIAGIVALALLVGVGVLVSSGDTSSTTRNAALVVAKPCTKPGQVTKVSKQSVVCAALSPKNIWYPVFQEKKWICAKLGITRKQNGIFSVCGKSKSSKKRWFLTKPLMASSAPGLPTTDQEAFIKLTTNPELIVETSPTTPLALAATTETTLTPTTNTPTNTPTSTPTSTPEISLTCATGGTCKVGDAGPGGGKVFYVAPKTFTCGKDLNATPAATCKYLEAAPTDYQVNGQGAKVAWGCKGKLTGVTATAIGTGKANTATILEKCIIEGIAADVANKYSTNTAVAGQWFLPSKDELIELCKYARQPTLVASGGTVQAAGGGTACSEGDLRTGFAADYYWSSSEILADSALSRSFGVGYELYYDKDTAIPYVRPVRAF